MEAFFDEKTCYQCGGTFIVPDCGQWTYKKYIYTEGQRMKYFCCYSCMQAFVRKRSGRSKISEKHKSKAE